MNVKSCFSVYVYFLIDLGLHSDIVSREFNCVEDAKEFADAVIKEENVLALKIAVVRFEVE